MTLRVSLILFTSLLLLDDARLGPKIRSETVMMGAGVWVYRRECGSVRLGVCLSVARMRVGEVDHDRVP